MPAFYSAIRRHRESSATNHAIAREVRRSAAATKLPRINRNTVRHHPKPKWQASPEEIQEKSAPEGIRTPNLLTYSAVSEGLTESTEMCLQQAFSAGRDIPIWVNPYESTDVCSGKVADSRFRRRAFRWRNSDGGRTCRNLVSEANSPVGPATGRQALTELIVHGESSALRTVPLMDVREWWRSGFPEFAANPRTRPLV